MSEPVVGLNIRKEASSTSPKLGILPRGARIEVGERSSNGRWAKIARVIEGQIAPVRQGDPVDPAASTGWVFLGELDPDAGEPELDRVVVLPQPRPIRAGTVVGHLGQYHRYEDAAAVPQRTTRALLHLEVFSGDDVPAFVARSREYAATLPDSAKTLLLIEQGARLVEASEPDTTIAGGQFRAAGGAAAGRWVQVRPGTVQVVARSTLGAYTTSSNTYAGGQVWTGWYVGATDGQRTRNEAEGKNWPRREVMVPSGSPVWVDQSAVNERGEPTQPGGETPAWSAFPLQVANATGAEVPFSHVRSRAELERTSPGYRAVDADGKKWWRVDVGADRGARAGGWVCEKDHPKVSWQSPWAWPGFEFVEEGEVTPADLLSRDLLQSGDARAGERADFKARADKVEASALVTKLYEHIDANRDGRIDPQELRAAVRQPVIERGLSRIIAKYESEWGGEMTKWDELDPLMLDGLPEWQAEKRRIDALRWWTDAAAIEGFPADPTVHHIHPIALVANFMGQTSGGCCDTVTIEQLRQIFRGAAEDRLTELMTNFNEYAAKFDLNRCLRKAHFFAQVYQEVGDGIAALQESMNYTPAALIATFGYFANHPAEAQQLGRADGHAAQQQAIANRAYGNRYGNGDIASGDGWNYRGKGYIQLTFRDNYNAVQREINTRCPGNGLDIGNNPDQTLTSRGGLLSAMGFWTWKGLNALADAGDAGSHVDAITAVVNLKTKTYANRRTNFETTKVAFKVSECRNRNGGNQAR